MIKINLLREPSKAKAGGWRPRTGDPQLILVGVSALVLILLFAWYWSLSSTLQGRRTELADLRKEKADLARVLAQIQQARETKALLDQRVNLIDQLRNGQSVPIRLVNGLLGAIPSSPKLWLSAVTQLNGVVSLEGQAFDVPSIADFITSLNRQEIFGTVELEYWEEQQDTIKFKLNCRIEE